MNPTLPGVLVEAVVTVVLRSSPRSLAALLLLFPNAPDASVVAC